jgi:2-keto-4-pentenoate hydratase/2-oxohepta-3-ene-1,7-dioic acid hydratase (catechol pathway)
MKLPCLLNPSKIIALGLNYRKHAAEMKETAPADPVIFLKPPTSVIGDGDYIIYPEGATKVDYEAELAVVIGKDAKNISEEDAPAYILGYTCGNDVSERVFQKLDGQWTRAKGFDTFCPLGPVIETELDPANLNVRAIRNGETVQSGNTRDMIHNVYKAVSFISKVMTLKAGDVILTGTPEGIGEIKIGDEIVIEIEGIGRLKNKVKSER